MWHPLVAWTQTITIKQQGWHFGRLKSQKVFYNQQLRQLSTITCVVCCYTCFKHTSMLTANMCLYMASLRPFSISATEINSDRCWMRLELVFILPYWLFGDNKYWYEYDKANCFNANIYHDKRIRILTPKTADKCPPRDHFEMLALEHG